MNQLEKISCLNRLLLDEMPQYQAEAAQFPQDQQNQRRLLRSLMNVRPALPLQQAYVTIQDALLSEERAEKGVVDVQTLPVIDADPRLVLWQGDITRLNADAIVNAANSGLTGCYCPCHGCIDNAIHSAAGSQLRDECSRIMAQQGHAEPAGQAKLTRGYNLPCKYVLHTVGPIIHGPLHQADCDLLAACYRACLTLAAQHGLQSVAFCCISTGEFHFPHREAAEIAVKTVTDFLKMQSSIKKVIFNVFQESDKAIYRRLLGADRAAEV